jgi:oligopeptide/dipeptide ABC transporter ATP-binding protein
MADFIGVMYGGSLMEIGRTDEIFFNPTHPYTMGLLNAFPDISMINKELISIPGVPPSLIEQISGCPFIDRCPFAESVCTEKIGMHQITETQYSACHYYRKGDVFRSAARKKKTWTS